MGVHLYAALPHLSETGLTAPAPEEGIVESQERSVEHMQHDGGYKVYAVTWFWLFVFTVLEIGIVLVHVPKVLLVISLVTLALMKATLIIAYFMHLRYERLSFIYAVVVPLFLGVILFFGLAPDAVNTLHLR